MDSQVVKAEVMMIRLQNTGLLVYSVLRKLVQEDLPQSTDDQAIREKINAMRENRSLMTRFKNMVQEDCPNLKQLAEMTIEQYRILMQPIATKQPTMHFDLWTGLYKYMLQHFYVYPHTLYQPTLYQSVELVQQTWRNFIVEQIPMAFDQAQTPLTVEALRVHEQRFQESSASVMTTLSVLSSPPRHRHGVVPLSSSHRPASSVLSTHSATTAAAAAATARPNTKRIVY